MEAVRKSIRYSNYLIVLWGYTIKSFALSHNAVPRPLFQAQGKTQYECIFGNKSDISRIFNFGSHEWVHCREHGSFPENKEKLGIII